MCCSSLRKPIGDGELPILGGRARDASGKPFTASLDACWQRALFGLSQATDFAGGSDLLINIQKVIKIIYPVEIQSPFGFDSDKQNVRRNHSLAVVFFVKLCYTEGSLRKGGISFLGKPKKLDDW